MLQAKDIITQHFSEAELRTYFVGYDYKRYRLDELTKVLINSIVDFSFGYHTGILKKYDTYQLGEAAKSLYRIKSYSDTKNIYLDSDSEIDDENITIEDKYLKRGEFGELLLHVLLRDFINTVPLLSKIHFKDSDGVTVHGFDAVHIGPDLNSKNEKSLYLGETKLYSRKTGCAGKAGINDLISDIQNHFNTDLLYREFTLIGKKENGFLDIDKYKDTNTVEEYRDFLKTKNKWFDIITQTAQKRMKLETCLKSVTIPLLCTYQSNFLSNHDNEESDLFIEEYEHEIKELNTHFRSKLKSLEENIGEPIKTDLNIVLMLFPIPSKKEFVKLMHSKLNSLQCAL